MHNSKNILTLILLMLLANTMNAQDSSTVSTTSYFDHLDSLRVDSIRKSFILNHRPLSSKQLGIFKMPLSKGVYGSAVTPYINTSLYFRASLNAKMRVLSLRSRSKAEWLFYSFATLFILLGSILTVSPEYIKVIIGLIFRRGSFQDKSRETKLNSSLPSFMMNMLFFFSGSFFIYFTLVKVYGQTQLEDIEFILICTVLLALVYLFKFFFIQLCGWLFKQQAVFDSYFSYLSLVNKGVGLLFLFSSLLMAFTEGSLIGLVFTISLCSLIIMLVMRIINTYSIFSHPMRIGMLEFIIAFVSLEMMPTLVFLKFLKENAEFVIIGYF